MPLHLIAEEGVRSDFNNLHKGMMGCAAMYASPALHKMTFCADFMLLQGPNHIATSNRAKAKAAADVVHCAHHHCMGFATAGDTICKDGTIDAIHRRLHNPLTCAFVHLHGLRQSAEGQQAVSNKLCWLTARTAFVS